MKTLELFSLEPELIPAITSWYLADLGEALGKQELFNRQSPQKLKALREHAIIESAISSNRIEGIEVNQKRVGTIIFGKSMLIDRNEEEVRGYRQALDWIHLHGKEIQTSEKTIRELHRLSRGEMWDAGKYREKDGDIIEKYPNGKVRIRFKTVSVADVSHYMTKLIELSEQSILDQWLHPLLCIAAANLDFLCIHPFRDGNGRVSRLLLLLQCYHLGYEVGRYISLERLIEQNKERYYETLEQSSQGWHKKKHNPWPYINFILFILKTAYKEFEDRAAGGEVRKGEKKEIILNAIGQRKAPFRISELKRKNPEISQDTIRKVLKDLKAKGKVECLGKGQHAQWQKTNLWEIGITQ